MKIQSAASLLLLCALLCALSGCGQVMAHTGLKSSLPADGAVLDEVPESIHLVFNGPVRLLRFELLALTSAADATDATDATSATPQRCETDFQPVLAPEAEFQIAVTEAQGGTQEAAETAQFVVNWAAQGADGHTLTGSVRFTGRHNPHEL